VEGTKVWLWSGDDLPTSESGLPSQVLESGHVIIKDFTHQQVKKAYHHQRRTRGSFKLTITQAPAVGDATVQVGNWRLYQVNEFGSTNLGPSSMIFEDERLSVAGTKVWLWTGASGDDLPTSESGLPSQVLESGHVIIEDFTFEQVRNAFRNQRGRGGSFKLTITQAPAVGDAAVQVGNWRLYEVNEFDSTNLKSTSIFKNELLSVAGTKVWLWSGDDLPASESELPSQLMESGHVIIEDFTFEQVRNDGSFKLTITQAPAVGDATVQVGNWRLYVVKEFGSTNPKSIFENELLSVEGTKVWLWTGRDLPTSESELPFMEPGHVIIEDFTSQRVIRAYANRRRGGSFKLTITQAPAVGDATVQVCNWRLYVVKV
jgi:hypothetical protein